MFHAPNIERHHSGWRWLPVAASNSSTLQALVGVDAANDANADIERYRAALAEHDWHYEHSDDHRAWADGTNAFGRLVWMRKRLDVSGAIWNQYAPIGFRIEVSA